MSGDAEALRLAGMVESDGSDARVAQAIARATRHLLTLQRAPGQWQEPLEANATMEAEWIFFNHLLGRDKGELEQRVAERLLTLQGSDGGWPLHPGGPGDVSATVEAWVALRLAGRAATEPALVAGRDFVQGRGGPGAVCVLTRIWLALLGQFPWAGVPAMPVELVLLPSWAPVSTTLLSRWRSLVVPLTLLLAHRAGGRTLPAASVAELWQHPPRPDELAPARTGELVTLRNALVALERGLRVLERSPWRPLRRRAVARAIEWVLRHQDAGGQWAGSLQATLVSVLALEAVGFAPDHPVVVGGLHAADDFLLECEGTLMAQPATAPTLDTALAVRALLCAGVDPSHPALVRAAGWLVHAQSFRAGDWSARAPRLEPGGFGGAPADDWYPDVAVSAAALGVLQDLPVARTVPGRRALAYGINWTLGMQGRSGGWARFDVDAGRALPVAGLETALDAPAADTTGAVLELMAAAGYRIDFGRARRAVEFLHRSQDADGSWEGRWGVDRIHGTAWALVGLSAIGDDRHGVVVRGAVAWLTARQNPDGGWGEVPRIAADRPSTGGDSTPSQTAWALLGLIAAGESRSEAAARGIEHLVATQGPDGGWSERWSTGTTLPGRLDLRHHLYRDVFPLMALGRYRAATTVGA